MRRSIASHNSAIFLALALVAANASVVRADVTVPMPPAWRTITTQGDAQVNVVPDKYTLVAEVKTFDKVLARAYEINASSSSAVVALAKRYNVSAGDVQTGQISVQPTFAQSSYDTGPSRTPIGYLVQTAISFVVHDPKTVAAFIKDAIDSGANTIASVTFETSELRKHRDEARLMALRAAREKAELLCTELHSKLGNAVRVEEVPQSGYYGARNGVIGAQNAVSVEGQPDEADSSVALGRIPIKATVRTTFELQ